MARLRICLAVGIDDAFIDVFGMPNISDAGFDGFAGNIPGPTSARPS
jgi:hypothetical protein